MKLKVKTSYSYSIQKWVYAAKPASWPKILVPFFLGHGIGVYQAKMVNWQVLFFTFIAVVAGVIFIVFMNDWGDQKVDKIKRDMFPDGCSPKTIPDKILSANQLLVGGIIACLIGFLGVCIAGLYVINISQAFYFGIVCCLTFVAYTLPPFKLNYRGGGELLEMLGVGFLLPAFIAFLQSGELIAEQTLMLLLPFTLLALASAIASGLSDEKSDIAGGKTTVVTLFGNRTARLLLEIITICSVVLAITLAKLGYMPFSTGIIGMAQLIVIYYYLKMRNVSKLAVSNAFKEQKIYKHFLHQAIWWSAIVTACMLFISIF